jgi:hypothetical protein
MKSALALIMETVLIALSGSARAETTIPLARFRPVAPIKLLCGSFLCMVGVTSSYAENAPLSMTISSIPANIDPNDDFFVNITVKNISTKPFSMGHFKTLIAETKPYDIYVTDQYGKSIPYRKDLRHPEQMLGFNEVALVTLQPGEFFVDRVVLDDLFDLSKPGRYTVEIDRKLLREWGGWELHSNRITITIPG